MFKSNRQCVRIHVTCKQQMPPALVFQAGGQNEVFAIPNTAAPFFVSGHGAILINNRKLFQQQVCDIKRYRRCMQPRSMPPQSLQVLLVQNACTAKTRFLLIEKSEEGVCACGDVCSSCEEEMSLPLSSSLIVASCNEGKRRKATESSALIASH